MYNIYFDTFFLFEVVRLQVHGNTVTIKISGFVFSIQRIKCLKTYTKD